MYHPRPLPYRDGSIPDKEASSLSKVPIIFCKVSWIISICPLSFELPSAVIGWNMLGYFLSECTNSFFKVLLFAWQECLNKAPGRTIAVKRMLLLCFWHFWAFPEMCLWKDQGSWQVNFYLWPDLARRWSSPLFSHLPYLLLNLLITKGDDLAFNM